MPELTPPLPLSCAVMTGTAVKLPETVTAFTVEGDPVNLPVTWLSSPDTASDGAFAVFGVTSPVAYKALLTVYSRSDMDNSVITDIDDVVSVCRCGEKPSLPCTATVHFNNGAVDSVSHSIIWSDEAYVSRKAGSYYIPNAGVLAGGDAQVSLKLTII